MNDERNPYIPQAADPVDGQQPTQAPEQPYQQPAYDQQPQQQPYYPQPPYQQATYQQQPYPQQPYYGYAQPQRGSGVAKAFSIVSFAAGCISLLVLLSSLISLGENSSYRSASSAALGMIFVYGIILAIPGLVFGIVALVKKTRLFPLALLGVIFNGLLLLTGVILIMSAVIFETVY